MNFSLENLKNVLIIGPGDIGSAIINEIKEVNPSIKIYSSYRDKKSINPNAHFIELDPLSIESWKVFKSKLPEGIKFDLIISTLGCLKNENFSPEKKLDDINLESLTHSFNINAFSAPLAIQNLKENIDKKNPTAIVFLSAKVGSISDNNIGGWYSYRASKAALNMFVKTMAIEFKRKNFNCSFMSIHPGTTETRLSKEYLKSTKLKVWTPKESAKHILNTIEGSFSEGTGLFKNWNGDTIPW